MLSNFVVCISAVLPLFIFLVIGFMVRRFNILTPDEVHRFNQMVFTVFFPSIMFENLYGANIGDAFDPRLIIFACVYIFVIYFITVPVVKKIEPDQKSRGAMIQGIYRSNFVLMGLPIAVNIFGKGNAGVTASLIMFIVPIYNVLAVITLESFRGGHARVGNVIKKIFANPIIIGAIVGIVTVALGIRVPKPVESVISDMSTATTPIALILLGASFDIKSVKRGLKNLIISLSGRLVVVPAIGLIIAYFIGFRGPEFVALVAMLATPAAVSSYTMAESMDSNGELAGNIVIFSTPISCLTIFLFLFIFKSIGAF